MMTVDDYMKLSKRRLAEMLVERDEQDRNKTIISYQPALGGQYNPPCYAKDGICTNPQMDCINCPKKFVLKDNITTSTFNAQDHE